ncbi:hypothetical protein Tco_0736443 [Tanacetum coccineum]
MDFEKGGYGVETAQKDFDDTKNEEVEGKKSIKKGYQKERVELGSGTTKNVEESEDKKSVKEDKQMEYAESGSDTQKIVKDLRIRSLIKLTSRWNVLTHEVAELSVCSSDSYTILTLPRVPLSYQQVLAFEHSAFLKDSGNKIRVDDDPGE